MRQIIARCIANNRVRYDLCKRRKQIRRELRRELEPYKDIVEVDENRRPRFSLSKNGIRLAEQTGEEALLDLNTEMKDNRRLSSIIVGLGTGAIYTVGLFIYKAVASTISAGSEVIFAALGAITAVLAYFTLKSYIGEQVLIETKFMEEIIEKAKKLRKAGDQ